MTPRYARLKASGSKNEVIGWENIELISDRPLSVMLDDFKRLKEEFPDRCGWAECAPLARRCRSLVKVLSLMHLLSTSSLQASAVNRMSFRDRAQQPPACGAGC